MAKTFLYAPQVDPVQPGFIYDPLATSTTIPISFFAMNYGESISEGWLAIKIDFSIMDPSAKKALVGDQFDYEAGIIYKSQENILFSSEGSLLQEKIFVNLDCGKISFQQDKYYQVQIRLAALYVGSEEATYEYLYFTPWSKVTLIRPVSGFSRVQCSSIQSNSSYDYVNRFTGVAVPKAPSSTDYLKSYSYTLLDENETVLETSPLFENSYGFDFDCPISYPFEAGGKYYIKGTFTTVSGYTYNSSLISFTINNENYSDFRDDIAKIEVQSESEQGRVEIKVAILGGSTSGPTTWIERSDERTNFLKWELIAEDSQSGSEDLTSFKTFYDCQVLSGIHYKYRVRDIARQKVTDYFGGEDWDNIYLSDKNQMLSIKYNPKISNYKWVTQEAIVNSLGGAFPVIRINGDTKYRQFSLSGILFFKDEPETSGSATDSRSQNMYNWLPEEGRGYYTTTGFAERTKAQQIRDAAIAFLTNRKPKLFRSREEGTMIVYLSAISFTPNTSLGNKVYDFSVTVTEMCEVTAENMTKYEVSLSNVEAWL